MARSKPTVHKKKKANPAKTQMLVAKELRKGIENKQKDRSRMIWCMIIALADSEKVTIDSDALLEIIDAVGENIADYDRIKKEDGEEFADEKLNIRVNRALGQDDFADTPEKLYKAKY